MRRDIQWRGRSRWKRMAKSDSGRSILNRTLRQFTSGYQRIRPDRIPLQNTDVSPHFSFGFLTAMDANNYICLTRWRSDEPPKEHADLRSTIHVEPLLVSPGDGKPAEKYATRLSTVILIRRDGSALFIERDIWKLDEAGELTTADFDDPSERAFRLQVPI